MISIKTKSASPTRVKPRTIPPLNATTKASWSPTIAFLHVRTLALTAIYIPIYPETIEVNAPRMKGATFQNSPTSFSTVKLITTEKKTTKILM